MTKQKLYVDFDGTIVNSIKAICYLYNEDFLYYPDYKYVHWTDINTWYFDELKLTNNACDYFNTPRFFKYLEFMDNSREVLSELSKDYDITVVTIGSKANLYGKELWIKKNLPFCKMIGVDEKHYSNKGYLDLSDGILIDDKSDNLYTSNALVNVCFGDVYPWNEDWEGLRCSNWYDVKSFLKGEK